MNSYSIHFKNADSQKINAFIDFVKSLDFVQSVESFSLPKPAPSKPKKTAQADEFQTVAEIKRLFPNEWVLLANPRHEGIEILGGTVVLHDPDKRSMAVRGRDLVKNYQGITHFFTGEFPKRATIGLMRKINK